MSKKSKFLKSATLAIAGVALVSGLSSCKSFYCKHKCAPKNEEVKEVKEEKAKCSSKHHHSMKEEKAKCSSKAKEGKAKCSSKKEEKKAE